jgi:hypothetical protein
MSYLKNQEMVGHYNKICSICEMQALYDLDAFPCKSSSVIKLFVFVALIA